MNNSQCAIALCELCVRQSGLGSAPTFVGNFVGNFVGIFVEFDRQYEGADYDCDYDYDYDGTWHPTPAFPG